MFDENEFKFFIDKNMSISYERRLQRARGEYLSEYKERFIELLIFLIATEDEFPKSFEELEGLANEENKEGVAVAKEAFGDLAEALCSIKEDVPVCLLLDEYAAILIKFKRCLFLNDAKQDWYKKKNISFPKKAIKSFDVTEREYAEIYTNFPINLDDYKSGKTLINEFKK